jgi:DNA modification methylase
MINKIILGDCLEVMKNISDKYIDVSFTSPPYNSKRHKKYKNFSDNIKDYHKFLCDFTNELLRITKKTVIVNIQSNYYNRVDVNKYIGTFSDKIDRIIIWNKLNPTPASSHRLTNSYEYFFIFSKNHSVTINSVSMRDVIEFPINSLQIDEHKAVMNIDICNLFIKEFTNPNDLILDCFSGSGTTAIACHNLNRRFICIEKDYDYWKASVERLEREQAQMRLF